MRVEERDPGAVTRRHALWTGAASAGLLTLEPAAHGVRDRSFDEGWRCHLGDAPGAQAPDFDDGAWRLLDLPEVTGPFAPERSANGGSTGYTVGGIAWYRKEFRLGDLGDRHVELRFDGVYQSADVWLNGTHLGCRPYGYTPFGHDLTPRLRAGANVLAVRVDHGGRDSRWRSGSGIYRHTWLTVTGPVRIPLWGVNVNTAEVGRRSAARAAVSVTNLGAEAETAWVRVTVRDPRGLVESTRQAATDVAPGATTVTTLELPVVRPRLWSSSDRNLYTAHTEILVGGEVVDTVDTTFGIRTLTWHGAEGLALNARSSGSPTRA